MADVAKDTEATGARPDRSKAAAVVPSPGPASPGGPVVLPRGQRKLAFAGLMLVLGLASLDQNIVNTSLPRIAAELGGLAHLSWVVSAFVLGATVTTPLYGKLSDMYGRKPLFLVAIGTFVAGSMLCGLARSMDALILCRAVQGLGAGGLIPLVQITIGDLVELRERGRYQGLATAVFGIGSVAGPLIGGLLTDWLSWPWIFYVNLPVGIVAAGMVAAGLPPRRVPVRHHIDYLGFLLLSGATSTLLLVLSWGGGVYPWTSWPVLAPAIAAAVLAILFLAWERKAAEPVLPLRILRDRAAAVTVAAMLPTAMALFGGAVFLPVFFQLVLGHTPTVAGLLLSPMLGGVVLASVAAGRLVSKTGRYKFFILAGSAMTAAAFSGLSVLATLDPPLVVIEACLTLLGLGLGLVLPNLTIAMQNAIPRSDLGAGTSLLVFVRLLGGAMGVAVSGAVLTMRLSPAVLAAWKSRVVLDEVERMAAADGYRHALAAIFLVNAVIAAAGLVAAQMLPERPLARRA